jgi:hypothetical protein
LRLEYWFVNNHHQVPGTIFLLHWMRKGYHNQPWLSKLPFFSGLKALMMGWPRNCVSRSCAWDHEYCSSQEMEMPQSITFYHIGKFQFTLPTPINFFMTMMLHKRNYYVKATIHNKKLLTLYGPVEPSRLAGIQWY